MRTAKGKAPKLFAPFGDSNFYKIEKGRILTPFKESLKWNGNKSSSLQKYLLLVFRNIIAVNKREIHAQIR